MEKYESIDHTADLGIKIRGTSLEQLAMFDIMAELDKVNAKQFLEIEIQGEGMEELLIDWLRNLLYKFNGEEYLLKDFVVKEISEKNLRAKVGGEKLDLSRHSLKREIKAVTYHELEVKRTPEGWEAQVIFDI